MIVSEYDVAVLAEKIAACPAPAPSWTPTAIGDLIKRIDAGRSARQAA
jgi:hypothetical protein